jgi:glycosyltransferase involved in cell wall biosynthesis
MKVTIVYPFRDREKQRVQRSLDSLKVQTNTNFTVLFIDYGSSPLLSTEIRVLTSQYQFVDYHYLYTQYQPWNKSKALNYALSMTQTDFFFVADIDMIFRSDFIELALQKIGKSESNIYFKVGYLSKKESVKVKRFEEYIIQTESNYEATGLTLFRTFDLKYIGGFDDFFHFWGSEDTEVHVRLRNSGFDVFFYDEKVLLLHQWHPSYMRTEKKQLSASVQLSNIIRLNFHHLNDAISKEKHSVESLKKGNVIDKNEFLDLKEASQNFFIFNKKDDVTYFLFVQLPKFRGGVLKVRFEEDPFATTMKYHVKRILCKKVPQYYTLKEINDQVLLHIISFYHQYPYMYEVSSDLKSITFAIKK